MIPVDISTGIFLYIMFALVSIFTLWALFERSDRGAKGRTDRSEVWTCSICTYTYVDSTHDTISACPRCHSLNKKETAESQ